MSLISHTPTFLSSHVSRETFDRLAVSRETLEKVEHYSELLKHLNTKKNLVGRKSIQALYERHLLDGLQVGQYINLQSKIYDLGSGNGIPGVLIAILGGKDVSLFERERKKASLLKYMCAELALEVAVYAQDYQQAPVPPADIITSRALGTVRFLLDTTSTLRRLDTQYILLKGKNYQEELDQALQEFQFTYQVYPSLTDQTGKIITISHVKNADTSL